MKSPAMQFRRSFALGILVAFVGLGCGERKPSPAQAVELPAEVTELVDAMANSDVDAAHAALAKIHRDKLLPAHRALTDRVESQLYSMQGDYVHSFEALD